MTDGIYLNALQACSCDEALLEWKISEFVIQRDFLYLNKQITETTSKELSSLTSVLQIAQWIREQVEFIYRF